VVSPGEDDSEVATAPLPAMPAGLLPPPVTCAAFAKRAPAKPTQRCATREEGLAALDAALAPETATARDARLVALESCPAFPAGVIRGIRAELAPECADVIVAKGLPKAMRTSVQHALVGAAIAARATRMKPAPAYVGPGTPESITGYLQTRVQAWDSEAVAALKELDATASTLTGYGHALARAAVAQGYGLHADSFRRVSYPRAWDTKENADRKPAFFTAVEAAYQPARRVTFPLAASALSAMGDTGAATHWLTDALGTWLRKNDKHRFLDLAVANLPPPTPAGAPGRLAAKLPTFYAGILLEPDAASPDVLGQWAAHGVPPAVRAQLSINLATLTPEGRAAYADAQLKMVVAFGRSIDHDELAHAVAATAADPPSDRLAYLRAVTTTLRPTESVDSADVLSFARSGAVPDLDAVVGSFAGYAHLLAGELLRSSCDAGKACVTVLTQAEQRYERAATELPEPAAQVARNRTQDMQDIVRFLNLSATEPAPPAAISPDKGATYILPDQPRWRTTLRAAGTTPPMNPEDLQKAVRRDFFPVASKCYEQALRRNPVLEGTVVLAFTIVGNAKIGGVEYVDALSASTLRDPGAIGCLRREMRRVSFPSPPGGRANVIYPFRFSLGGSDSTPSRGS
jgi:hypothetical protein